MKISAWTNWGPQRRRKPRTVPPSTSPLPDPPPAVHVDYSAVHTPSDPGGRVFMSPDEMFAALGAKPVRGPAVHLRYPINAYTDTKPTTACGKFVAAAYVTSAIAEVTCGGCKRTGQYRQTTGT